MVARVYYSQEAAARTTTTTIDYSVTKLTLTFIPSTSKTYAIFWRVLADSGSTGYGVWGGCRLYDVTLSSVLDEQTGYSVTVATTQKTHLGGVSIFTASNGNSHSFAIQVRSSAAGNTAGFQEARICALELTAADQYNQSLGNTASSSASYVAKCTLSFTPATTGDYLVIASCQTHTTSAGVGASSIRIYDGSTANAAISPVGFYKAEDLIGSCMVWRAIGQSGAKTWTLDHERSDGTDPANIQYANLIALRCDQFENVYWAEDLANHTSTSTSWTASAAVTATPLAVNHLIIGTALCYMSSTGMTTLAGFRVSGTNTTGSVFSSGAAYATHYTTQLEMSVHAEAATSTTWQTEYSRVAGTETAHSLNAVLSVLQLGTGISYTPQILYPDAILASTNLTGAVTDIDEDPDSPDASWLTATSAASATDLRVSFPTPTLSPSATQNFRYLLRKTTGTPNPTIVAELRQSNTLCRTFQDTEAVTSTSGAVFQGNWSESDLVTVTDGSDVELRIVSTTATSAAVPGVLPVQSASPGAGTTTTSGWTANALTMPTHAVGDLLIAVVASSATGNDAVLTDVNGSGGTTGWTLENNSGSGWGGAQITHIAGFGWKVAASTSEVCSVTTAGTGTTRFAGRVYKFTATNGFASGAVANIGSATSGNSSSLSMPTVASGGTNELGIALCACASNTSVANSTGESGGDWTQVVTTYPISGVPRFTLAVEKADLSGGGGISGGTSTLGTGGVWVAVGFRVVPAIVTPAQTTTVEIGAIEWNAQYLTPTGGVTIPQVENLSRMFDYM